MHIEFTQADESYIGSIVKLVNFAYRGEGAKQGWTTEADLLDGQRVDTDGIREMINSDNSVIIVAENDDNGELIGCVHLEKHEDKCYLGMLTVDPTLQNKGIGKMLIEESEALAQFWDCKSIYITVISVRDEIIAWYKRHGFQDTGEKKPFPVNDKRFGIPKVKDLEFSVLNKGI